MQTFILDHAIWEMQQKLAHDPVIKEAEKMGFVFNIELPKDSAKKAEEIS